MSSLEHTDREAEIAAKGPRVSLADVKNAIKTSTFKTAAECCGVTDEGSPLRLMTLCFAETHSGYVVVGKSACVSPENFNAGLGQSLAMEDVLRQLWPLMGFVLRENLYAAGQARS